jgi:hypothetical protein
MLISAVYIRFFRSFNFDYLRKAHERFAPDPWDIVGGELKYPFVKVPLEADVTTVVGANESGKSQLLSAVKCALTGEGTRRGDFCRYSQFFAVDQTMAFPDFGLMFSDLIPADREALGRACGTTVDDHVSSFQLFRINGEKPIVYLPSGDGAVNGPLQVADTAALEAILPRSFEIDAKVALPDSVPLKYLAEGKSAHVASRRQRLGFLSTILNHGTDWFASADKAVAAAPQLVEAYNGVGGDDSAYAKQLQLAEDLLLKVAGIDRMAFEELMVAVGKGDEGYCNGVVKRMNAALAARLNFPKWWSQDHQFELLLTLRDQDLVFTIRDRTGTEYSADERSGGLKYFLSYFVQYLAHEPPESDVQEILLMDEPDAYLSSTGQQDLLRIFEDFAHPHDPERKACQVVYVTHSPFLIDKNHGERIRVLEKGEGDEGTRVVKNASRNHYEPLRSAFGSFVAETTFISNCNLMLEGTSDQVLLAGMSARLRKQKAPSRDILDLNTVTLVPAGSAGHIPYLVYLARGRDVERPAVIVLLDSDPSGNQAAKELEKGRNGKRVIDSSFVLQLGSLPEEDIKTNNPGGVAAIEDLVPDTVALAALKHYTAEVLDGDDADKVRALKLKDIKFGGAAGTHDAIEGAAKAKVEDFHLDKVAFARAILDVVATDDSLAGAAATMDTNFRTLFRTLGNLQRRAMRDIATEKTSAKIKRIKTSFLLDRPHGATREQALVLLEDIEAALETRKSLDDEELRLQVRRLRNDHKLENDPAEPIEDYNRFREALDTLTYRQINEVQDE